MRALPVLEAIVVAFEAQRHRHVEVGNGPAAIGIVEIVDRPLEEHADGFWSILPHAGNVGVAAADIGEAADMADDTCKAVRPLPRQIERTNTARTHAHAGTTRWIG